MDDVFDKAYFAGGFLPPRVYYGDGRRVKAALTHTLQAASVARTPGNSGSVLVPARWPCDKRGAGVSGM